MLADAGEVCRLRSRFPLQRKFDLNLRFASILGCLNHGLHRYILRSSVLRSAYSAVGYAGGTTTKDESTATLCSAKLRIAEKDKLTGILISIWWTGNGRVGIFLFFLAEIAKGWPKLSVELR